MIARIPAAGRASFGRFEEAVIPLIPDYGGTLWRRLRTKSGSTEIHVVDFPDAESFRRFRSDRRRLAALPLLEESRAQIELFETYRIP